MQHLLTIGFLSASLFLASCHGNTLTLRLPNMEVAPARQESPLTIAVAPFQDKRPASEYVGVYIHETDNKEYFSMRDTSLSQAVTRSFIHFMNQSGFSAAGATNMKSADIRIEADIIQFSANVTDLNRALSSLLAVDATMAFTIHNVADGSATRVTIGTSETSEEIFFNHHDMETLINSALKAGFTKVTRAVKVKGQTLKSTR